MHTWSEFEGFIEKTKASSDELSVSPAKLPFICLFDKVVVSCATSHALCTYIHVMFTFEKSSNSGVCMMDITLATRKT